MSSAEFKAFKIIGTCDDEEDKTFLISIYLLTYSFLILILKLLKHMINATALKQQIFQMDFLPIPKNY